MKFSTTAHQNIKKKSKDKYSWQFLKENKENMNFKWENVDAIQWIFSDENSNYHVHTR